jgi:thioesterase domain-containing protein
VTSHDSLCRELETVWHRDIPLTAAMGIAVEGYDGSTLTVRAPLAPNRNLHGTTFAGSLYSTCALTGWGAIWLALRRRKLEAMIVVAQSDIEYRKGVSADFVCRATLEASALEPGLERLRDEGRASLELVSTIDQHDKRAVTFTGRYVVRSKSAQTPDASTSSMAPSKIMRSDT